MIALRHSYVLLFVVGLALAGCSKPDPTVIIGSWKAESFAFESLRVPLAPNLEITRNHLILKSPDGTLIQKLALASIQAKKDRIELELKDGFVVSLEFTLENADRVHFKVPLIGTDIAFVRQLD